MSHEITNYSSITFSNYWFCIIQPFWLAWSNFVFEIWINYIILVLYIIFRPFTNCMHSYNHASNLHTNSVTHVWKLVHGIMSWKVPSHPKINSHLKVKKISGSPSFLWWGWGWMGSDPENIPWNFHFLCVS